MRQPHPRGIIVAGCHTGQHGMALFVPCSRCYTGWRVMSQGRFLNPYRLRLIECGFPTSFTTAMPQAEISGLLDIVVADSCYGLPDMHVITLPYMQYSLAPVTFHFVVRGVRWSHTYVWPVWLVTVIYTICASKWMPIYLSTHLFMPAILMST
jgi:hypothetical protein